jgi:hypothetical protein
MLRPFFIFLLLFFEACTMLKSSIPKDAHLALSSVQVLGEGKGRLGIKGQQYVFGLESLLNEKQDWILSASIPLHGEEILAFKNLKQKKNSEQEDSLEKRIEKTYTCQMDGETYELLLTDQKLSLSRTLASGKVLNLIAENPGAKFYGRTNFFLTQNKNQLFSLELFWK